MSFYSTLDSEVNINNQDYLPRMIEGTPEWLTTKAFERDLAEIEEREGNPAQEMKSWPIYVALKVFKHACAIQADKAIFEVHFFDRDHQKNLQVCQKMLEWGLRQDNARGQFVRPPQSEKLNSLSLSPDSGQRQDLRPSAGKEPGKIPRFNKHLFEEYQNNQVQHRSPLPQNSRSTEFDINLLSSIHGYKDSSKKNSERSEEIMKRTEEIEAKQEKQAAKQEKQAKEEPKKEKKAAKKKEKLEERITEQVRRLEFKGQGKKKITGEKRKSRPSVTMTEPGERKRSHSKKEYDKCEKRSSRRRGKGKGKK